MLHEGGCDAKLIFGLLCKMKISLLNRPLKDIIVAVAFLTVCFLLFFTVKWAYREFKYTPPYVDPDVYPVRGIDVSAHNGPIDMQKVKDAGMEFVFIKATEGKSFVDKNFRSNYDKALQTGLKIGVYHFFRFDRDGVEQAINLLRTVGSRKPHLGLVIDVEKTGNPDSIPDELINTRLTQMVDYLNLLGHRVMFYSNRSGYYDYISESFPGSPLWICAFSRNPVNAEWTFWQFNHRGKVKGVTGDVDMNAFCGSREQWDGFLEGKLYPYTDLEEESPEIYMPEYDENITITTPSDSLL